MGALFLTADRLGVAPLGFAPLIILLTAVHFHFAGFGLLALGSLAASGGHAASRVGTLALAAGMPLTAAGFTFDSPGVSLLGALVVGAGSLVVATALVASGLVASVRATQPVQRLASSLGGLALLAGVPLGVTWAFAAVAGVTFLDVDTMVRVHGGLNAAGVVLGSLAWTRGSRP